MRELDEVAEALAALSGVGRVAVERACPSDDLHLFVDDVGRILLPVSPAQARALIAVAKPAPYGRRDQTLYDPTVRDTWEIDGERVFNLYGRTWTRTLDEQLRLLRKELGLPPRGKLRAVLHKLLIYAPGQFFAPHQDSERADDMVGTLVVELPCRHTGGATVVEHGGRRHVFKGAKRGPRDLSLLAFYADCRHAFEPIRSGYRIVLTYNLHHPGGTGTPVAREEGATIDRLTAAVSAYFRTPIDPPEGSKQPPASPERLVYLLDHEYTESSFSWSRLKNADRVRANALWTVAERLDCDLFLALADVLEHWECRSGLSYEHAWRFPYPGWGGEDDEYGAALDGEEKRDSLALVTHSLNLTKWIGPEGEEMSRISSWARDDELCFTLVSSELSPWMSEVGDMGNEGTTVDRWYRRAALIIWPKSRAFALRAEQSPAWAVAQLETALGSGDLEGARAKAATLDAVWGRVARQEAREAFFRELCAVVDALDDAALAEALLRPFDLGRLTPENTPALIVTIERYGLAWFERLLSAWSTRWRHPAWTETSSLTRLCAMLAARGFMPRDALTQWMGDARVRVALALDTEPLPADVVPLDLEAALAANEVAGSAWRRLAPSHRREHVKAILEAKKPETRARRIAKAIELLTRGGTPPLAKRK